MSTSNENLNSASSPTGRRKRRSTEEIVDRILEAAFKEFGDKGYSNTTTAAIARRADVAEALIFNHFETKANLYRRAVFKPLDNHFSRFINSHHSYDGPNSAENLTEVREFVSDLIGFVRGNSDIFKSLVVNEAYQDGDNDSSGLRGLQDYFNKMASLEESRLWQRAKVSPHVISRLSFAAILGAIVFDDWLFPVGITSEREIHEGLCDFVMEGLGTNADMQKAPFKP